MSRAATTRDRARGGRDGRPGRGDVPPAVTPLKPRRRRARRRASPRRRLLTALAAAAVVLGALGWLLLGSPLLAVRTVQVDGEAGLSADLVARTAGIPEGTPLVRVDTAAAAARVAALPQVDSVEVTRGWPSTVVVTVAERVPVALVVDGGRRQLVDAEGVVYDTISGATPAGVVPLDVADPGPDDAATTAALGALTALPRSVRTEVTGLAARSADDVRLTLTDGREVLWGSAAGTDRKADVLGALVARIEAGDLAPATTLDVSTPDAVVLR
ncbi:cell division protein FtsQ/DivIB [Modestobacter versicolor]|uniref:cell division protein FtsQ/DivIB n=1 Tax=Modestobacter versicolor TaxID=429133 RepID=UPI0034E043E6